MRWSY